MDATIVSDDVKHYGTTKDIISVITSTWWHIYWLYVWSRIFKRNSKYQNSKVIAIDRDIESIKIANKVQQQFPGRFKFKIRFSKLKISN